MLVKADTAQEEATCYTANLQLILVIDIFLAAIKTLKRLWLDGSQSLYLTV